jgi:tRNA(fMet)-specific endonuclease VapC
MKYLVDTDWIVDYLKGKAPAIDLLTRLASEGLAISIITVAEIYEGIYYGRNREQHEVGFRQCLRGVRVLGITQPIARQFALLRGDLRHKGQLIGDPDIFIAATAMHHRLTLLTRNRKDYERFAALSAQFPEV